MKTESIIPRPKLMGAELTAYLLALLVVAACVTSGCVSKSHADDRTRLQEKGRYLATIGVCQACHTPPDVPNSLPPPGDKAAVRRERTFRTDPDWYRYLDPEGRKAYAGGVPFLLRFSATSNGLVTSSNITPDPDTGIGKWSEEDIMEVLRSGKRKDGSVLFLFTPHTFFQNLAEEDLRALAVYLKSLPPINNQVQPRILPFTPSPATGTSTLKIAPEGRTQQRAQYLLTALTGCRECHSYTTKAGNFRPFVGGDPEDPFNGVFRLGPDLPLRQAETGFANFPYPGYAIIYAGNLTQFGSGGELAHIRTERIVSAIKGGIGVDEDRYGRTEQLSHIMMWQFYSAMLDDDAFAIADYLKTLKYEPHEVEPRLQYFGTDWAAAFEQAFGEAPSTEDRRLFGKTAP